MPYPCPHWGAGTPLSAKSLNIGLCADDGSVTGRNGVVTGVPFLCRRPTLLECAQSWPGGTLPAGETGLGGTVTAWSFYDSSAFTGPGADSPGQKATFTFNPSLAGTAGDGTAAAGGWHIVFAFPPVKASTTCQAVGAALWKGNSHAESGARQAASGLEDNIPFYLDLWDLSASFAYGPAVFDWDTSSGTLVTTGSLTEPYSGESPRFAAIWAGPVSWDAPNSTPPSPAPFTAWDAYTSVNTTATVTGPPASVDVNSAVADTVNFLLSPPLWRSGNNANPQPIPGGTPTQVTLYSTQANKLDSYSGFSASTSTYTVQRDGIYLAHAAVPFANQGSGAGQRIAGIAVNGTIYWGPGYPGVTLTAIGGTTPGTSVIATKTQIFSLRAGDTVQLWCWQDSGAALPLSTSDSARIFLAWAGAPPPALAPLPAPPDPLFRWPAGAAEAELPGLLQSHLGDDLQFLATRPYLIASSFYTNAFTPGEWTDFYFGPFPPGSPIHGDDGAPWGFFDSPTGTFTAPRPGWYLAVAEAFTSYPASGNTGSVACGFYTPTQGGQAPSRTPDVCQQIMAPGSGAPPGATAVALVYLRAGETVAPQVNCERFGSAAAFAAGTFNGGNIAPHFECVWISE